MKYIFKGSESGSKSPRKEIILSKRGENIKKRKSLLEKIMFSILLSVSAVFVFTVTGCDSGTGFENYSVDECYVTTK